MNYRIWMKHNIQMLHKKNGQDSNLLSCHCFNLLWHNIHQYNIKDIWWQPKHKKRAIKDLNVLIVLIEDSCCMLVPYYTGLGLIRAVAPTMPKARMKVLIAKKDKKKRKKLNCTTASATARYLHHAAPGASNTTHLVVQQGATAPLLLMLIFSWSGRICLKNMQIFVRKNNQI